MPRSHDRSPRALAALAARRLLLLKTSLPVALNAALPLALKVALTVALIAAPPVVGQTPLVTPGNTGLAGSVDDLSGRRLLLSLSEAQVGADLNGDGDTADGVPHLEQLGPAPDATLPLAGSFFGPRYDDRWALASVNEFFHGSDVNGDGDVVDQVLFTLDVRTGALVNTGLTAFGVVVDGTLVMGVREQSGVDLNGDGDTDDALLHVRDLSSGITVNLGLPVWGVFPLQADGDRVHFVVDELAGGDVDGDGVLERLAYVYDVPSATAQRVSDTGLFIPVFVVDDVHVLAVAEGALNMDVNGDGNTFGTAIVLVDLVTGAETITDVVFLLGASFFRGEGSVYVNFRLAGTDPNIIPHRIDLATGASEQLPQLPLGDQFQHRTPVSDGRIAALRVAETTADLNGDGDTDDLVLHTVDTATGAVTNHGFAVVIESLDVVDGVVAALVSEADHFGVDRNADGDTDDGTPVIIELASGRVTELPVAAQRTRPSSETVLRSLVLFDVVEGADGARDANGDGDADDTVLHAYDLRRRQLVPLGAHEGWARAEGRRVTLSVSEAASGLGDLNGDGDAEDHVVHVVDL